MVAVLNLIFALMGRYFAATVALFVVVPVVTLKALGEIVSAAL